ncbi:MAG: TolC family protein [Polyangiaceae bacterium]|nr:TolC family protein [Polyangiaceae bacterium]
MSRIQKAFSASLPLSLLLLSTQAFAQEKGGAQPSSTVAALAAPAATSTSGTSQTYPQPTAARSLTLSEVVKNAQDRFPLVIAADAEKQGAEADLLAAEGGFDPLWRTTGAVMATGAYPSQRIDTVVEQPTPLWGTSVFAGYRIGVGKFADYDGKLETNDYGELRAGLRVPVLRDGPIDRRRATIKRAEIALEIAKLGVDQQKIEINRVTSQRYWDWVGAGVRLTIVEAWLATAETRNSDLKKRVERGDLPEIEQLENERSLLVRRAQLVSETRRLEQTAIDLSLFYRKADGTPDLPKRSQLPSSIPEPPPGQAGSTQDAETAALARRPEPKRADAVKASAAVELNLARNQALPAIDLFVAGSADLGPGDDKRGIPVFEAGIVIDIPILGRPQRGRVRSGEAAVKRAEKQAEFAKDRVGAEVKDAMSAMEAARKRAEVTASEVALAEKLETLERTRFDLGDSTMLIVNLREQATAEARLKRVDALVDYQKAVAAYRAAQGLSTPQ